jgi:hypothetical protein
MNVRKSKGHRTITFAPYGRIPLSDAKESVVMQVSKESIVAGKRNLPTGCALAVQAIANTLAGKSEAIPGLLGIMVRKTATIVAVSAKGKIRAIRYAHSPDLTRQINGFDKNSSEGFKSGDMVELLAPAGHRRIGKSNGRSNSGSTVPKNPRRKTVCVRRGMYVDKVHAAAAQSGDPALSVRSV